MMDIDHFKMVNDEYGHMGGDQILKDLSGEVLGDIRVYDLFARYGGEEFIILFMNIDRTQAAAINGRILEKSAEKKSPTMEGRCVIPSAAAWRTAWNSPGRT
jgi:diguanylate cyclase (GGDEF)-like protein